MAVQNIYPLSPVEDLPDQVTGFKIERDSGPDAELIWDDQNEYWEFVDKNGRRRVTREGDVEAKFGDFTVSEEDRNKVFLVSTSSSDPTRTVTLPDDVDENWSATFVNDGNGAIRFTASGSASFKPGQYGILSSNTAGEVHFNGSNWYGGDKFEYIPKFRIKETSKFQFDNSFPLEETFAKYQGESWAHFPDILDMSSETVTTLNTSSGMSPFLPIYSSVEEEMLVFDNDANELLFYDTATKYVVSTISGPFDDGTNQVPIVKGEVALRGGNDVYGIYSATTYVDENSGKEFLLVQSVNSDNDIFITKIDIRDRSVVEIGKIDFSSTDYASFAKFPTNTIEYRKSEDNILIIGINTSISIDDRILEVDGDNYSVVDEYTSPNNSSVKKLFYYNKKNDFVLFADEGDDQTMKRLDLSNNSVSNFLEFDTSVELAGNKDEVGIKDEARNFYIAEDDGVLYTTESESFDGFVRFSLSDGSQVGSEVIDEFGFANTDSFFADNDTGKFLTYDSFDNEAIVNRYVEDAFSEVVFSEKFPSINEENRSSSFYENRVFETLADTSRLPESLERPVEFRAYSEEDRTTFIKIYNEDNSQFELKEGKNTSYRNESGEVKFYWDNSKWRVEGDSVSSILDPKSGIVDRRNYEFNTNSDQFGGVSFSKYNSEIYIAHTQISNNKNLVSVYNSDTKNLIKRIDISPVIDNRSSTELFTINWVPDLESVFLLAGDGTNNYLIQVSIDSAISSIGNVSTIFKENLGNIHWTDFDRLNQRLLILYEENGNAWVRSYDFETGNLESISLNISSESQQSIVSNHYNEKVYLIQYNEVFEFDRDLNFGEKILNQKGNFVPIVAGYDESFLYLNNGIKIDTESGRVAGKEKFEPGQSQPGDFVKNFFEFYQEKKRDPSVTYSQVNSNELLFGAYNAENNEFYEFISEGVFTPFDNNDNVYVLTPPEDDPDSTGFERTKKELDNTLDYTLEVFDTFVRMKNSQDKTITVPLDSNKNIGVGAEFTVQNKGSGILELVEDASSLDTVTIEGDYRFLIDDGAEATLRKVDKNTWVTEGDIYKQTANGFEK